MKNFDNIVTGVVHNNSPEWLHDDIWNGEDIDYYEYLAENPDDPDGENYEAMSPTMLIGVRECEPGTVEALWDNGEYAFEPDPEAEYVAIVGEIYTQIIKSNWGQFCRGCSPCYPFQGDLDSDVSTVTIYGEEHDDVQVNMAKFLDHVGGLDNFPLGAKAIMLMSPLNNGIVRQGYTWAYTFPPDVWGENKPELVFELDKG